MEALENSFKQGVVSDTIKDIETTKQEKANKKAELDKAKAAKKAYDDAVKNKKTTQSFMNFLIASIG